MSVVEEYVPTVLQVTPAAAAKVRQLALEEGQPELCLRVYVTGGGCSGFQYGFDFADTLQEDDTLLEAQGARFVIDALSYPYLQGSTLDYVEGLEGARFVLTNPNAVTTCSCGVSFSV